MYESRCTIAHLIASPTVTQNLQTRSPTSKKIIYAHIPTAGYKLMSLCGNSEIRTTVHNVGDANFCKVECLVYSTCRFKKIRSQNCYKYMYVPYSALFVLLLSKIISTLDYYFSCKNIQIKV